MSGVELNISRISNLTPEQIGTVNRLMSRDPEYARTLVDVITETNALDVTGRITDMEIRTALYTMAGSPRVTEVLDLIEETS
jgi:hypothetical protein